MGELRSSVNGVPLLRHSLNKPAARGRQPKMSTPIPKKIPNRPKGKPEGDANQVLEPRAGIKPTTDCMMMLTFSSVGVSVITLTRHRFHFVSSYHCWAIHPSQQKNIFMANQSAHQLGHIKSEKCGSRTHDYRITSRKCHSN